MASFKDINTIANDATFQGRCVYALEVAAIAVMNEASATADHQARAQFARQVLAGQVPALHISLSTLTNSTISAEANIASISTDCGVADGDIQFAVNSNFAALAGLANK